MGFGRLVVLDGYVLNPGDLSWERLARLGELTVYDRTPPEPEHIIARARGAQLVFTNKTPLRAETLAELPELRYIGVLATGYDVVDVEAAARQGITVTNVPEYGTDSVAQAVFALLLELCHRTAEHAASVRRGDWSRSPDFAYWLQPLRELSGSTLGIVGYGRIGRRVAQIARAFGMQVVAARRPRGRPAGQAVQPAVQSSGAHLEDAEPAGRAGCADPVNPAETGRPRENAPGVERLPLEQLLPRVDVLSLHCPLTPDTQGLIDRTTLALMRPHAFLINTARGRLVVEQDLADALRRGAIAGAALDVLAQEPPAPDNPLLHAPNCLITPHIAWASHAARRRLLDAAVANAEAFLAGRPTHVVAGPA